eukprot:COSAG01_NODE_256_length_20138_cov_24.233694_11_plen_220_part_00
MNKHQAVGLGFKASRARWISNSGSSAPVLALCGAQLPVEGEGLSFFLVDGESGEHQPLAMSGGWGEGTPPIGRGRGGVIELRPIADAAVSGSDRLLLASTDGWLHLVSLAPLDEASASLPASGRGEMRVALPAGPTETVAAMDCDAAHCVIGGERGSLALVDLSRPDMCARPPSFTPPSSAPPCCRRVVLVALGCRTHTCARWPAAGTLQLPRARGASA